HAVDLAGLLPFPFGVPLEGEDLLTGFRIPHLDGLITTTGGNPLAVGAERHAPDLLAVTFEGQPLFAGAGIPHFHRIVGLPTARDQPLAVRAVGHAGDLARRPLEGEEFAAAGRVPDAHSAIRSPCSQVLAVRAVGCAHNGIDVIVL